MHSVSPYLLRCFDPSLTEKKTEEKFRVLDKIGQNDMYILLKDYITSKSNIYDFKENEKIVFGFQNVVWNDNAREFYGWMLVGHYGIKSDIINTSTGGVDFEKAEQHAEIIKHYIHFDIPKGKNEAIILFHSYRGNGIKTLFFDLFREYFKSKTNLTIQMNPISYEKSLNKWQEANTKEIKLIKFNNLNDIADKIKKLGHEENELTITTSIKPSRGGTFGEFKIFRDKNSEQSKVVEILSELCEQVKTVVELNGRKRTFAVGKNALESICEIEVSDDVEILFGNPVFESMNKWCREIIGEFKEKLYPN